MSDRIGIRGLRVGSRVGVTDEERATAQTIVVDLDLHVDLSRAGESDDIADTFDYADAIGRVCELLERAEVRLLETLAHKIAALFAEDRGVAGVTVKVAKESVPIAQQVGEVSVSVHRRAR